MTQTQVPDAVPQAAIKHAIEQAVAGVYGESGISMRVVRQHRNLQVGSLRFIDYAVPCFELARSLRLSPEAVATAVADHLQAQGAESQDTWQYEAVAGYINVQLATPYLLRSVASIREWFGRPAAIGQGGGVFLVTGMEPSGPSEKGKLYIEAYRYIDQVCDLLSAGHSAKYLLSDFSERMPHYLSKSINERDPELVPDMREHARVHQAARKFFIEPEAPEHQDGPIAKEFNSMRNSMLEAYKQRFDSLGITSYDLATESDMIRETHQCVDKLEGQVGKGEFIKDDASFAVYYIEKDTVIPIRSAEGLLHEIGYLFCMIEKELVQSAAETRSVVVFAQTSLQQLVTSYADDLAKKHGSTRRVTFFDAHVSRADIFQLQSSVPSVGDHFQKIGQVLSSVSDEWLEDNKIRQRIISFVDLPETLTHAVQAVQLPLFFDILSESAEILEQFND